MNKEICIREFRMMRDRTLPYIEVIIEGAAKVYFREVENFYEKCRIFCNTDADYAGVQCKGVGIFRRNPETETGYGFLVVHPDELLLKDALELLNNKMEFQRHIKYLQMWLSKLVKSSSQDTRNNLPENICALVPELRSLIRSKDFTIPVKEERSYKIAMDLVSFYLGLRLTT